VLVLSSSAGAADKSIFDQDRTTLPEAVELVKDEEKPALRWLWEDQLSPTIKHAGDNKSLWIFAATAAATALSRQKDEEFRDRYGDNKGMSDTESRYGAIIGSGFPGIAIAATQLYFDTDNGLQHARALAFTSATHITIAASVGRKRPNGKSLSFPSGHTSSSFATASSLAYSYGPYVGVPALAAASYIGLSRLANNAHWLSDTIAGAGLGIFWARASSQAGGVVKGQTSYYPIYTPSENGPMIGAALERHF